jgi:tetratricopeptide (TPR) repeat protein
MRPRMTWRILMGLVCLGVPVGCQNLDIGDAFQASAGGSAGPGKDQVELPPDKTAQVCRATAERLEKAGKDAEAIILYEKARKADPRMKNIYRRLAVLYDRQGDFSKALHEYEEALKLTPHDPDLHNDVGYAYYCRGRWQEAESHLRQAVAVDPQHARAWINLGMTLGQEERYGESLEAFTKAVSPAQAKCNLAFTYTTQGKREEAKEAYRKALQLEPSLAIARAALAKLEKAGSTPADKDKSPAEAPRPAGFSAGAVKRDDPAPAGPNAQANPEWRQARPAPADK